MILTVSGYLIGINIDFTTLSVFSLGLVSIEKIGKKLKTVFNCSSKHLGIRQKYFAVRRSTIFSVFGNVFKHGFSCLIYYLGARYRVDAQSRIGSKREVSYFITDFM